MQKTASRRWLIVAFFLTLTFYSCNHFIRSDEIPVTDFFRNPESAYFKISPNGNYISFLKTSNRRRNIYIRDLSTGKEWALTHEADGNIVRYAWLKNDQIYFVKDHQGDELYHLFHTSLKTRTVKDLTPYKGINVEWVEMPNTGSAAFYFGMNQRKKDQVDIYKLDTFTGKADMIIKNPGKVQFIQLKTDIDGVLRSYVKTDGEDQELIYRQSEAQPFRSILHTNFRDRVEVLGFSNDGHSIYASSNIGRDRIAIVSLDPLDGKEQQVIYEHPEVDVRELYFSLLSGLPRFATAYTWKREIHILDNKKAAWFRNLSARFPKMEVAIADNDMKEEKFLIRIFSDKTLGSCYLYNIQKNTLIKVADLSPWINSSRMASINPVSFNSRDGLTLHGYLTIPLNEHSKNLPCVILVHPGPYERDRWAFNREAQFLANRGYAVLQVNYRGSTGYGRKFWEASFGQWGLKIQNDIEDGAKWLVSKEIADKGHIGILGQGFGGYCALEAASRNNGIFSCGVSYSGFTNIFSYLQEIPPQYKALQQMYKRTVGNPATDMAMMKSISPIFNTSNVRMNLLIAQGEKYTRTNANETRRYVSLLKKEGNYPELLIVPDEGYNFTKDADKLDFYTKVEVFFEKHLRNR